MNPDITAAAREAALQEIGNYSDPHEPAPTGFCVQIALNTAVAQAKEESARLREAADKAYHALRTHGMTGYADDLKVALSQQPNQTGG